MQDAGSWIEVWINCGLSLTRTRRGDFAAAEADSDRSLTIARETGSRYVESFALSFRGCILVVRGDYSEAQACFDRSVIITEEIRNPWDGMRSIAGLGCVSRDLGDYAIAGNRFEKAVNAFRDLGARAYEGRAIADLALLCHQTGDNEAARELCQQVLGIAQDIGQSDEQATALTYLGHALAGLGQSGEAADAYRRALDLRRELGQHHLAPEPLAGLARVALTREDPSAALAYLEEILSHLETGGPSTGSGCSIDGTGEPLRVYLTCYRVLRANQDPRAERVLEEAHNILQARAAKIDDEDLRRSFLENVTANREIAVEWKSREP